MVFLVVQNRVEPAMQPRAHLIIGMQITPNPEAW